jgi:cellulose synthase/poly-beta-1,6-N-acetylglucosamine synthase-like glycosyltransferase
MCLDSLASQEEAPAAIILVDDGSNDDTSEIARTAGIEVIRCDEQRGPASARNRGVEAASGDVILFLDADVTVPPDLIGRLTAIFDADQTVEAVQTLYTPLCPATDYVSRYQNFYYYYSLERMRSESIATFATWCAAVKRSVFIELGGFNTLIPEPTVEDEEFGYEIADRGGKILLARDIQVTHLASYTLGQFTRRRLRMARAQSKSGLRSIRKRLLKRYVNLRETGTHHSRWVVLSILLTITASVCLACSLISFFPRGVGPGTLLLASLVSTVAALLCHRGYFRSAATNLGVHVLPAFALICLVDMTILGCGIVQGTWQYLTGKHY